MACAGRADPPVIGYSLVVREPSEQAGVGVPSSEVCRSNRCEELVPVYDAAVAGMPAVNLFARGQASIDYPWRRAVTWFTANVLWVIVGCASGVVAAWNWFRWLENRRERFRDRGWCVECGYDVGAEGTALGEVKVCPECGAKVREPLGWMGKRG